MAILVLPTSSFVQQQLDALRALAPDEIFHTEPERAPAQSVEAILAFRLREGIASRFPNLRFIACAGAGADEILAAGDLSSIPVVRPIDPAQSQRLAQYVALMALRFHRDLPRLERQHGEGRWERFVPEDERGVGIGVLGFGESGRAIAHTLAALGFPVCAWRRSGASGIVDDIDVRVGDDALARVLAAARVLVCTLPLTPRTRGLIDRAALEALPSRAYVIDVSRGGIIDHDALLELVDARRLSGAALDVFREEPLPASSAMWKHPRILCTPHIAGPVRPEIAAAQLLDNLRRARAGQPLVNVIDRAAGY